VAQSDPHGAEIADATRRTRLANERTELAWWRTGLTALAVALGIGRVVPELNDSSTRWPYVVAGVGFALWGILAIAHGSRRSTAVERVLEAGGFPEPPGWERSALAGGGIALGLLTAVLILVD